MATAENPFDALIPDRGGETKKAPKAVVDSEGGNPFDSLVPAGKPSAAAKAPELVPPKPKEEYKPSILERLQGGVSDAMSAFAGDEYSRNPETYGEKLDRNPLNRAVRGASEVIEGVGDATLQGLSNITPDFIEKPVVDAVSKGVQAVANTEVGQKVREVWGEIDPDTQEMINSYFNVATVLAPGGAGAKGVKTAANKAKQSIDDATRRAQKAAVEASDRATQTKYMLQPDNLEGAGRRVERKGGKHEYVPTAKETEMYEATQRVPEFNPRKSYTYNNEKIELEVERLRNKLDSDLDKLGDVGANPVLSKIQDKMDEIAKDESLLVGDAQAAAGKVFDVYLTEVRKLAKPGAKIAVKDLLEARRQLDRRLNGMPGIWQGESFAGTKWGGQKVRQLINDTINELAGNDTVKNSLRNQHLLLEARDIMRPRMYSEAESALKRYFQNLERSTGITHPTTPLAAGATASAAATTPSVSIPAAALAVMINSKSALTKQAKLQLINARGYFDDLIEAGKVTGDALKQAKIDRAVIADLIETYPVEGEDE